MNVLCTCRCLIRWLFNFTKSPPLTLTRLAFSYLHYYGNIKWLERFTKNSCHHLHQFRWCPVVLGIVCQLSLYKCALTFSDEIVYSTIISSYFCCCCCACAWTLKKHEHKQIFIGDIVYSLRNTKNDVASYQPASWILHKISHYKSTMNNLNTQKKTVHWISQIETQFARIRWLVSFL